MTSLMARLSAFAVVAAAAISIAILLITSTPGLGGTPVKADFRDAYPLLPGMYVRVSGAVAGTVARVDLTDRGYAEVTMQLNDGTEPPHADASAAIRQQDVTGDSYVALEPGTDSQPLGDTPIGLDKTLVAPRFDDLLNSFDQPTREGLKAILVELGKALDRRGADLNSAALDLRSGLEAANQALGEVRSQNTALASLVDDTEHVLGQAADRKAELAKLIDGLATTGAAVDAHSPQLDAALERAPETAKRAQVTLGRLAKAADAAVPLAETVNAAAPDLATTARRLGPFLVDIRSTLVTIGPTLRLTAKVMRAGTPTLAAAPRRALTAPFDLASSLGSLLDLLLGDPQLAKGLFGADGYGQGPKSQDDYGLGSVGVETGLQPGYGANDPERRFLRAIAVPSCEMFGRPIAPGCLSGVFPRRASAAAKSGGGGSGTTGGPEGGQPPLPGLPGLPDTPGLPGLPHVPHTGNGALDGAIHDVEQGVGHLGDGLGLGGLKQRPRHTGGKAGMDRATEDVLDFLMGP